jgi:nitrogen regulatory protein PII
MKKVEAVIQIVKLDEVREALLRVGVNGVTISEVMASGEVELTKLYRGSEYVVDLVRKVKIEALLDDAKASQVVEAIRRSARTGKVGDGDVFVVPIDDVVRIRTGERGAA